MADILPVDDYFGVCPMCLNAAACNIGRVNWMYCREHSVKWRVGENLFSTWRYATEEKWSENYELLKDFGEIEPHSSYLNNPSNETLQPCACDRCVAGVLSAISAAAKGR
jgi:hypothetical protein